VHVRSPLDRILLCGEHTDSHREEPNMKNCVSILSLSLLLLAAPYAHAELGVRITLPICDRSMLPSNFVQLEYPFKTNASSPYGYDRPPACKDANDCSTFFSQWPTSTTAPVTTVDWGNDNALYAVHDELCNGPWWFFGWMPASYAAVISTALSDPNTFNPPTALAHVHGFVNSPSSSSVQGQVVFALHHNTAPLALALQVLDGNNAWVDVQVVPVSGCDADKNNYCNRQVAEISATVPGNSDVRLELRGAPGYTELSYQGQILWLYEATLFGTECFPDASNPGMCLQ
jgi:hypothetical protein